MKFSKGTKLFVTTLMVLLMSHIPNVAVAEMIPTSAVLADVSRAQAEKEVREFLQTEEIKQTLIKQGVSVSEIDQRLASLSEQEIRQLSFQVNEARAGGDILIAILVVVLIIFLVKRI